MQMDIVSMLFDISFLSDCFLMQNYDCINAIYINLFSDY